MTMQTAAANADYGQRRVRQFVLCRDAHLPRAQREAMFPDLQFLPAGR